MTTHQIDARRLLCPMPVIRLQDAIRQLEAGDVVEMTCTDPGVKNDVPAWSRINRHEVIDIQENDDEIVVKVRVGGE